MEKRTPKTLTGSPLSGPFDSWLSLFRKEIIDHSVTDDQVKAFLFLLADIDIFYFHNEKIITLNPELEIGKGNDSIGLMIWRSLCSLAQTEKGWAIGFFLKGVSNNYQPPRMPEELLFDSSIQKKIARVDRPISPDLSNLHIVRKVGRQLSPFLEMENRYIERLTGNYLQKSDAQKLYRHILRKCRPAGEPLPWQQLSRRRHK